MIYIYNDLGVLNFGYQTGNGVVNLAPSLAIHRHAQFKSGDLADQL
jgi:hypothetical protein